MEDRQEKQDAQRIMLIKETILSAEKSLQTAKSLLAQIESKYTPQKKTYGVAEGGKVVEGTFDGQIMIGIDGRQYPVPANYASKSKLVEGDMLKLVITDDGNFIYKQIGPFRRKRMLGVLKENAEEGGYSVEAEGKIFKVLLAAVTYHHASPNDEIAVVVADNDEAQWAAIENVTKKAENGVSPSDTGRYELKGENTEHDLPAPKVEIAGVEPAESVEDDAKVEVAAAEVDVAEEEPVVSRKEPVAKISSPEQDIDDEITPDLEELEKELKDQVI